MRLRSKLGRKPAQRKMLVRNLVTSLILYESVRTTKARAKAIQPLLDRMIAKAKSRPRHTAVRYMNTIVTDPNASRKMFDVLVERFKERPSGFSSITAVGKRRGDGAELVEISLVDASVTTDTPATKE